MSAPAAVDVRPSDQPETPETPVAEPSRKRRWPWFLGGTIVVIVLLVVMVAALLSANGAAGDPRNSGADGTMAVATLLRQEGARDLIVDSENLTGGQAAGATVVVTDASRLDSVRMDRLLRLRPARIVLPDAEPTQLGRLGLPDARAVYGTETTLEPQCSYPAAVNAGAIQSPRIAYSPQSGWQTRCYPVTGGYALIATNVSGVEVIAVAGVFRNRSLDREGAAALAMWLAGGTPRLVWWSPARIATSTPRGEGMIPLLPPVAWTIALQGIAAFVVLAAWRGRRFGPLMAEGLPVVIRASETVEGHGRLYEQVRAAAHASGLLRRASRERLSRRLGTGTNLDRLCDLVAARTGEAAGTVRALLDGPDAATGEELASLHRALNDLERKVGTL